MSRKGESIFKRKDGRYEGRYIKRYLNGKAVYGYVYANSYNECKRKRNIILMNLNVKKEVIKFPTSNKDLNFLIDKWLSSKDKIKESSYTRYYNLIQQHIRNDIGKTKICKLNEEIVNKFLEDKLKNGKIGKKEGLSKNTVYDICNILKQVFNENDINIELLKITKTIGKGKSLYPKEKNNLEKRLNKASDNISVGILLSLFLGLRKSEICGLRWSDIDLENKVIHINQIIARVNSFDTRNKTKLITTTPKTENSIRELPIPNKLYKKLLKLKSKDNYYFLTDSVNFMDPRTFYNHYKRKLKFLDINYTYHDLRHTFATNCVELGIDYKTLMELLGHSSITTTMNIYVHPTINDKRNFINQL